MLGLLLSFGVNGFGINKVSAATTSASSSCGNFTDVSSGNPYCAAVNYVSSIGAMTGNPDGTFQPDGSLQRDQIAKIVLMAFKNFKADTNYCGGGSPFPDVTPTDWSYQYICQGKNLNMITGYQSGADAGFYRPARSVNRAELLALVIRNINPNPPTNLPSYKDVGTGLWYSGYANFALTYNLFPPQYLYPDAVATRQDAAFILYTLHQAGKI
jgi:hypothetical protein